MSEGDKLQQALQAARAARAAKHDPELRLAHAQALVDAERLIPARREARRALDVARSNPGTLPDLGKLLIRLGLFKEAEFTYRQLIALDPSDADALRALSSLAGKRGERRLARRLLVAAAQTRPLRGPQRPLATRANVVRMDAPQVLERHLVRDKATGLYKVRNREGHFKVADLIARDWANRYSLSVAEGASEALRELPINTVVVNTVACAELGHDALDFAARLLADIEFPVINPPTKVLRTSRELNYERLAALHDVEFPRTERIRISPSTRGVREQIEALGLRFPLIVRRVGTQTGRTVSLMASTQELHRHLERQPPGHDYYLIEYVDCRFDDGYYGKCRVFFINGKPWPVACLSSDTWQIHSADRYRVMADDPACQERERHYLASPREAIGKRAWTALYRVARRIDLDFFGIDFFPRTDGITVFEANPAMRHNFDHAGAFPYTRAHLQQIGHAFTSMLRERLQQTADRALG